MTDTDTPEQFISATTHMQKQESFPIYSALPYQACPICQGQGRTLSDGFTTNVFNTCTVCDGRKIIPMHVVDTRFDVISFILKTLPAFVTCDGRQFNFQAIHDGNEFRICYSPVHDLPEGWTNPITGRVCSFLYLNEAPTDLDTFASALLHCWSFLLSNKGGLLHFE